MDDTGFWDLVDRSRTAQPAPPTRRGLLARLRPGADEPVAAAALRSLLQPLPDEEVRSFGRHFYARKAAANRWDVWAAGYVAMGGLGDDSFLDFRTWLVMRGQSAYERVLADPDALVEVWEDDEEQLSEAEFWASALDEVWEKRSGAGFPEEQGIHAWADPVGEPFPEDDDAWFRRHLPRLSARYL